MGWNGSHETLGRPHGGLAQHRRALACLTEQQLSESPEQLSTQFMLSVWCGANRFERGEVTRHDPVLKRIVGFTRMAHFKVVMRLFRHFTQSTNEGVMDKLLHNYSGPANCENRINPSNSRQITRLEFLMENMGSTRSTNVNQRRLPVGRHRWMVMDDAFDADKLIEFLYALIKDLEKNT